MSVSSVSASNNNSYWQQIRNNYQSLSQALQTGNLTAAQTAYSAIQEDQQNGPQPPANSPAATAFSALGQALQSGDLSAAQTAFTSFQNSVQSMRQAHGGSGRSQGSGSESDQAGASSSSSSSSSDSASKTVTNEATTTNANGTLTVTTTYSDGSTSSTIEPNPTPPVSQSPLAANGGQLAALLNAQEQVSQTG